MPSRLTERVDTLYAGAMSWPLVWAACGLAAGVAVAGGVIAGVFWGEGLAQGDGAASDSAGVAVAGTPPVGKGEERTPPSTDVQATAASAHNRNRQKILLLYFFMFISSAAALGRAFTILSHRGINLIIKRIRNKVVTFYYQTVKLCALFVKIWDAQRHFLPETQPKWGISP